MLNLLVNEDAVVHEIQLCEIQKVGVAIASHRQEMGTIL
jgi:hypothetical protein